MRWRDYLEMFWEIFKALIVGTGALIVLGVVIYLVGLMASVAYLAIQFTLLLLGV